MTGESRRRVRVLVGGRVQGVGFRWSALEEARRLGLTGWIRNLPGGEVEALIEGTGPAVERMIEWLGAGPPAARVSSVGVEEEPYRGEFTHFSIERS